MLRVVWGSCPTGWMYRLQWRPPEKGVHKVLILFNAHQVSLSSVSISPCSLFFRMNELRLIRVEKVRKRAWARRNRLTKMLLVFMQTVILFFFFFEIPNFFFHSLYHPLQWQLCPWKFIRMIFDVEELKLYYSLGAYEVRFVQIRRKRWIQKKWERRYEWARVRELEENWKNENKI